jgi:UDPglucose--hexose-1-phosphate uridylyltransferase
MMMRSEQDRIPEQPHRRRNALTGEWVLVSPHRTERPWQGQVEPAAPALLPRHDPACYLCPGNRRANGATNPAYTGVFAFDNDFSALLPETGRVPPSEESFAMQESVTGVCRVLCFSPRHDLTLALMSVEATRLVIDLWSAQIEELGRVYPWVQIFENRGEIMGCSNPHPHGQLWAGSALPNEPSKEDACQAAYRVNRGSALLVDDLRWEDRRKVRIVTENDHWVALVPFWAVWPFETLLLPRRHVLRLPDLDEIERDDLARILKRLLVRYDNLFHSSFPYTMGWHGAPHLPGDCSHWQLHAHFYPPLLRSAAIRKFMVGYEMLAEPQRDITPEVAAERLQSLPDAHYLEGPGA